MIDPGKAGASSSFAAMFARASSLLDEGDVEEAAAIAARMAALAAERPDVLWLQARVALARSEPGIARERLVRLLGNPQLTGEQRAEAALSLGIALDLLGEPAAAFAAASQGKRLQRVAHAALARSREGEVAKLGRLAGWIAALPAGWPPPVTAPQEGAAAHVFLLGFPRSGTTLLEHVLATHPRIVTLEEAPTLAVAYQHLLVDAHACAALTRLGADGVARWRHDYWATVRRAGLDVAGKVFVDKQPAGTLYLPLIARLFPHATILFALRDPRDVVLSCFRQAFQMNAMTYAFTDLAETAACYDACMRLAANARSRLPLAWSDVRHETLVDDFHGEIARILAAIGLEPDAGMADFARAASTRAIRTPSAVQIRAGLNRRGLRRWERYRRELAPVLPVLAPWVERFGYAP